MFEDFFDLLKDNLGIVSIVIIVIVLFLLLRIIYLKRKLEETKETVKAAELAIKDKEILRLRAEIDPHFFNNTLQFVHTTAERTLLQTNKALSQANNTIKSIEALNEVLNYIIYESKDVFVPLKNEIVFIEKYIDLQKIRLQESDKIKVDFGNLLESSSGNKKITPLIIVDFIENAFKYTNLEEDKAFISIKIDIINENELVFSVRNYCNSTKPNKKFSGFGIETLKKRLELLYPDRYWIDTELKNKEYHANLKIILDE